MTRALVTPKKYYRRKPILHARITKRPNPDSLKVKTYCGAHAGLMISESLANVGMVTNYQVFEKTANGWQELQPCLRDVSHNVSWLTNGHEQASLYTALGVKGRLSARDRDLISRFAIEFALKYIKQINNATEQE